ncbi:ABC transporter ATP-binding protein [Mesorhizobium sp. BAC0120]|uniref:ABC transporter ATP-binding protein n=1 Tax=Mesorhizobium sp. BAC0120 TaxID=3090670 RepID=UPI00298C7F5C|nr:ABC transporter ATP-binding protein [Mesorhizobium sp. BAC0120]MDW6021617.1 ABC transporter ATP-binding protein [Mesorhizobium sp. BAC0120]
MASVRLEKLSKSFGQLTVIDSLDLSIEDGEFMSFVGPSGCGKSTLLRMICGIEEISAGCVLIDGAIANDLSPKDRGVSMVFQSYALYPHMTVRQNMGYALKLMKLPKAEIARKVEGVADVLRIGPLLDRYPRQLSGGQRQRVAIGRAITRQPKVFLFDEPLSNLDAALRVEMRVEIARLASTLRTTMIYVTHDQTEAMTLSDRIVVLDGGTIQQVAAPLQLYHNPANRFVATFIGSPRINLIPGRISEADPGIFVPDNAPGSNFALSTQVGRPGEALEVGIRPEHLTPVDADNQVLVGPVAIVERLGTDTYAHVDTVASERPIIVRVPGDAVVKQGERLRLKPNMRRAHVFAQTGRRISPDQIIGSGAGESHGEPA